MQRREVSEMHDLITILGLMMDGVALRQGYLGGRISADQAHALALVLAEIETQGGDTTGIRKWLEHSGIQLEAIENELEATTSPVRAEAEQATQIIGEKLPGGDVQVSRTFRNANAQRSDATLVATEESEVNSSAHSTPPSRVEPADPQRDIQKSSETAHLESIYSERVRRVEGSASSRGHAWNHVPRAIEEAVRQRYQEGWSKSRIARELKLNRRTVIRICKEMESRTQCLPAQG